MPRIKITSNIAIKGRAVRAGEVVEVDATDAHLLCDEYKCAVLIEDKKPAEVDNRADEPPLDNQASKNLKKGKGKRL